LSTAEPVNSPVSLYGQRVAVSKGSVPSTAVIQGVGIWMERWRAAVNIAVVRVGRRSVISRTMTVMASSMRASI